MSAAELVSTVTSHVKAAIVAYGGAVLTRDEDEGASSSVRLGRRILQLLVESGDDDAVAPLESVITELANNANDEGVWDVLTVQIRQFLVADDELAAKVRQMLANVGGTVLDGTSSGDHARAIHQVFRANLPHPEDIDLPDELNALPRRPSPVFVGRDDTLDRLSKVICDGAPVVVTDALNGTNGVGKTELALQYADAFRDRYRLIGWITADTPEHIGAGLAALAVRILPEIGPTATTAVAAEWAVGWLQTHSGWLLVLDNVEDDRHVESLLGRLNSGHILITSRRPDWGHLVTAIELEALAPVSAIDLLVGVTGAADRETSGRIAAELGRLSLPLEQAAAYIKETGVGLDRYLELLCEPPARMYGGAAGAGDAQRGVARVWDINRSEIEARNANAVRLLNVLVWYAAEDIPRELIAPDENGADIDEALDLLASYSMIKRGGRIDGAVETVGVHRDVQAVLRSRQKDAEREGRKGWNTALDWLMRVIPDAPGSNAAGWPLWRCLIPHIETLARQHVNGERAESLGVLLNEAAAFHSSQAAHSQALRYRERVLAITEAALGPEHLDVATVLANLASTYRELGLLAKIPPLEERALTITEAVHAANHPDVAVRLGNLARAYRESGRVTEALPLAERALAITEAVRGPEHPDVATVLGILALTFKALGLVGEVLPLEERALAITEARLGPEHPDVAMRLGNLASTYRELGWAGEALPLEERALAITEATLGPEHPDVAMRLGNLASTYSQLGRPGEALPLEERALAITEATLGEDHPHVATALGNLASTYSQLGRAQKALPLEERALAITEATLGEDHPHVATTLGNLALTFKELGQLGNALPLAERAVGITAGALGTDHPYMAIRLGNLAVAYRDLDRMSEAQAAARRAYVCARESLGDGHPTTECVLQLCRDLGVDLNAV